MTKSIILLGAICLGTSSSPLVAQSASSSGYTVGAEETVSVPLAADVTVSVGPVAPAGGNAPPPYDTTSTVLSATENAALTSGLGGVSQQLLTDLLTTNANGTATAAEATSTVNEFTLSLSGLSGLINLTATTIQSYSQANSNGGLDASGTTTIEGLDLSGSIFGSLLIDGSLYVNPAPNTVLFSAGGLSIILNEQFAQGDGVAGIGIETNAIHIGFDNFLLGTGLLNGDIIVGHSQAFASAGQAAAVPEPATWAMMLLGFGVVGASIRRRKLRGLAQTA